MLIFIVELAAGVAGYVYKGKVRDGFTNGLSNSMQEYGSSKIITATIDNMQDTVSQKKKTNFIYPLMSFSVLFAGFK